MVAVIERTEGAIGYVEASCARFHELPTALVGNAAGEFVCAKGTAPLVKSFLAYAVSPAGQAAATRLGYAPLPDTLRAKVAAAVAGL